MNFYKNISVFLLLIAMSFSSLSVYAQEAGDNKPSQRHLLGIDYSLFYKKNLPSRFPEEISYYNNFEIGLSYEYRLSKHFSLLSGIGYYKSKAHYDYDGGRETDFIRQALQIPVGFRYYFWNVSDKLQVYTDLVAKLRFYHNEPSVNINKLRYRLRNHAADLSLGIGYNINDRIRFTSNAGLGYDDTWGFHFKSKLGLQLKF